MNTLDICQPCNMPPEFLARLRETGDLKWWKRNYGISHSKDFAFTNRKKTIRSRILQWYQRYPEIVDNFHGCKNFMAMYDEETGFVRSQAPTFKNFTNRPYTNRFHPVPLKRKQKPRKQTYSSVLRNGIRKRQ